MDLFSVICETCAARLKVRQVNAIGQKLACPKCGTMLVVLPPQDWKAPPELAAQVAERVAQAEVPEPDFDFENIDQILAQQQQKQREGSPASAATADTSAAPIPAPQPSRRPAAGEPQAAATPNQQPLLPNNTWASDSEKKKRKLLLIVAGVVGALVIGGGILAAILANQGKPVQTAQDANSPVAEDPTVNEDAAESADTDAAESTETADGTNADAGNDTEDTNQDETPDTTGDPAAAQPPDSVPPTAETNQGESAAAGSNDADDSDSQDGSLDLDIPSNPMANQPPPSLPGAVGEGTFSTEDLFNSILPEPPKLGPVEALLDSSDTNYRELSDIALDSGAGAKGISKYHITPPVAEVVNVDESLNKYIAGIRNNDVVLLDLLYELHPYSGIAFDVDAFSWRQAGIPFDAKTSVDMTDTTLAEVVDSMLESLQLERHTLPAGPVVQLSAKGAHQATEVTYAMPPVGEEEKQKAFVEMLPQLIEPASWPPDTAGVIRQQGTDLLVKAAPEVHAQLEMLFKKLQAVAASNEGKPDDAAMLPTRRELAQAALTKPLAQETTLRLPLWVFLSRVRKQTGVTILVDWAAVSGEGWTPATTIPGHIIEQNVEKLANELAHAMQLDWRVIDATTIELTTIKHNAEQVDVEVYPILDLVKRGVSAEELNQFVFVNVLGQNIRSPQVRIIHQPELQCVIAVAPQHLQNKIAAIIKRLKSQKVTSGMDAPISDQPRRNSGS